MTPLTPPPTCMHSVLSHLEPKLSQSSDNLHLIYGLKSNLISKTKYQPQDHNFAKTHHFLANMTYRYTYMLDIFFKSTNSINTLIHKPICIQISNQKPFSSSFFSPWPRIIKPSPKLFFDLLFSINALQSS